MPGAAGALQMAGRKGMQMERDFIQKLTYSINNAGKLELVQRGHDGTVLIMDSSRENQKERKSNYISAGDMVMLINYYRYIIDNDIQNDFINPNGINCE